VMKMLGAVGWMEACSPLFFFRMLLRSLFCNSASSLVKSMGFFSCLGSWRLKSCWRWWRDGWNWFCVSPSPRFCLLYFLPFFFGSVLFFCFLPPCSFVSSVSFWRNQRLPPRPLFFFFFLSLFSSRFFFFFLVLSSLRMPCGPVLSVFNARVKEAVFFFSGEEDELCWGSFAFWSLMLWKFCNQALG
jgi:hypothetical protein